MASQKLHTRVGVIMAGGSGERFWPLSRHLRPKQLLRLTDPQKNMLQEAVERLAPVIPAERVYIITGDHLVEPIREAGVGIPPENIVAEPCKRNTSGALAYIAAWLIARYGAPETVSMAIVTADHQIGRPVRFADCLDGAMTAAEGEDALVTMGIVPTRPETGYGYIQAGPSVFETHLPTGIVRAHGVSAFHEKPNRETADRFLADEAYFWNSGMFFWTAAAFLREAGTVRPQLAGAARRMAESMAAGDLPGARAAFETIEDLSIDYALMEKAERVLMIPADYPWDDVGAWTALERTQTGDHRGNVALGDPVLIESDGCIVYNEPGAERIAVAAVGCEDLVIVVTGDAVLVAPKDRVQDVRKAVQELKARGAKQI